MTTPHSLIDWTKLAEWLGKSWQWVTAIFFASLLFLVLPEATLGRLGVGDFVGRYHSVLVMVCFVTGIFLLTHPISGIYRWVAAYIHDTRVMRVGEKHLQRLNPEEKKHCKWFVDTNGSPLTHNLANGAIASLLQKGILIPPVQQWPHGLYDFNIQPWALECLKKYPELLK